MKTRRKHLAALLLLSLCLAGVGATAVSAHEQKAAETDVFYNVHSGNLEVAHRFILHDAEHVLRQVTHSEADLLTSAEARRAFSRYVASRFAITRVDEQPLEFTLVGEEIDGGALWVYQETSLPQPLDTPLYLENRILQDVITGQVNRVNVRYGSQVKTFVFEVNTGKKRYDGPVLATPATGSE
ncbi:DUF6702 family protein [Actomonas aquatica]|uniref:DUF6702 family protein n=1 Tax=Actomonas aquatica TaxID=2866162 RepID=A0ABZ1CBG4_9BACT|nr:DUF6702 family protein [Opitutus sp. WL0086]WRQ88896.1 DUF6702 family protein [Opitutus sp. WL0086]